MKKFFLAVLLVSAFTCVYAQDDENYDIEANTKVDTSMQVIIPENNHCESKTEKIKIEYTPSVDEVRIYYSCLNSKFEISKAREIIHHCLADFQLEHNYFGYKYLEDDRSRPFKDNRKVPYMMYQSHVKFTR